MGGSRNVLLKIVKKTFDDNIQYDGFENMVKVVSELEIIPQLVEIDCDSEEPIISNTTNNTGTFSIQHGKFFTVRSQFNELQNGH